MRHIMARKPLYRPLEIKNASALFLTLFTRHILVRASQFAVRGSWFVVVLEQGGGSIYHRLFLRRKCAEQSECPVRVTVDGMF